MKTLQRFFAMLLLALICAGAAIAQAPQEFSLEPSEGPTQGMKRVGCNIHWVNWLLAENEIPFNQIRSLPVGKVFTMKTFDCTTEPGPQEHQASELVMWDDKVNSLALQTKRENELLKVDLAMQRKIYGELEAERNALVDTLNQAQTRIKEFESSSAIASTQETWSVSGWKLGALCFAFAIVAVFGIIETIRAERLDRDNGILRLDLHDAQKKSYEPDAALARANILLHEERGATKSAQMHAALWQEKHRALKARQSRNLVLIKNAWRHLRNMIRENNAIINDLYEQLRNTEASLTIAKGELHRTQHQLNEERALRQTAELAAAQLRAGTNSKTPLGTIIDVAPEENPAFVFPRALMRQNRQIRKLQMANAFLADCAIDFNATAVEIAKHMHTVLDNPQIQAIVTAGVVSAKNGNGQSPKPRFVQPADTHVHAH